MTTPDVVRSKWSTAFTSTTGLRKLKYSIADDFNRADATTLGSTSVGAVPYSVILGSGVTAATFGIDTNTGRCLTFTGTGNAGAFLDGASLDFQYQVQLTNTPGSITRIWFRA